MHRRPRRRLCDHNRHRRASRLTLMSTDADEVEALDNGVRQTWSGEKRPAPRPGVTIFYEQPPGYGARGEVKHIDTPMGLVSMKVTSEDVANLEKIFMTRGSEASTEVSDVYALKMKNNMK